MLVLLELRIPRVEYETPPGWCTLMPPLGLSSGPGEPLYGLAKVVRNIPEREAPSGGRYGLASLSRARSAPLRKWEDIQGLRRINKALIATSQSLTRTPLAT
jgi:hypothetical protein